MRFEYHCPIHGRVSELRDRYACPIDAGRLRCARPLTLVVTDTEHATV